MKLANINGRAHVLSEAGGLDVSGSSEGLFPAEMRSLLGRLNELRQWLANSDPVWDPSLSIAQLGSNLEQLGPPVVDPEQIFAVGLNYKAHGDEVAMAIPSQPLIFNKFVSSLAGPGAAVALPNDTVDWEVEMVVVIGKGGRKITKERAMDHVAGYCIGQDYSERTLQLINTPPQFGLAKSFENFSPIGPWITTSDEIDPSALTISCRNQHEILQDGNTNQLIFDIPTLVSYLSAVCELRTGDLIFSGTPAGVGMGFDPPRYIKPGWVIESEIEGLGRLSNRMG